MAKLPSISCMIVRQEMTTDNFSYTVPHTTHRSVFGISNNAVHVQHFWCNIHNAHQSSATLHCLRLQDRTPMHHSKHPQPFNWAHGCHQHACSIACSALNFPSLLLRQDCTGNSYRRHFSSQFIACSHCVPL